MIEIEFDSIRQLFENYKFSKGDLLRVVYADTISEFTISYVYVEEIHHPSLGITHRFFPIGKGVAKWADFDKNAIQRADTLANKITILRKN